MENESNPVKIDFLLRFFLNFFVLVRCHSISHAISCHASFPQCNTIRVWCTADYTRAGVIPSKQRLVMEGRETEPFNFSSSSGHRTPIYHFSPMKNEKINDDSSMSADDPDIVSIHITNMPAPPQLRAPAGAYLAALSFISLFIQA